MTDPTADAIDPAKGERDTAPGATEQGPAAPPALRIAYLIGAGASHACVANVASAYGILMKDLGGDLIAGVDQLVRQKYGTSISIRRLVNDVINADTDFEQIITFLDESASGSHKDFANDLRTLFEKVLRDRLKAISDEQGRNPDDLYFALLDMHTLTGLGERLVGFLTLNYDEYLEGAINRLPGYSADQRVWQQDGRAGTTSIPVIKLHGSFGWKDCWPISADPDRDTLWIPPGIQKAKQRYPFNLLWGLARELLECDVLRIIGCRLTPNDWDLISLLFSTQHTHINGQSYEIEIIDSPLRADEVKKTYTYLNIKSLLDLDQIGDNLVAEFAGGAPRSQFDLNENERETLARAFEGKNWFRVWLKQKAEFAEINLDSVATTAGAFEALLREA
jgi:hypothetical protein